MAPMAHIGLYRSPLFMQLVRIKTFYFNAALKAIKSYGYGRKRKRDGDTSNELTEEIEAS